MEGFSPKLDVSSERKKGKYRLGDDWKRMSITLGKGVEVDYPEGKSENKMDTLELSDMKETPEQSPASVVNEEGGAIQQRVDGPDAPASGEADEDLEQKMREDYESGAPHADEDYEEMSYYTERNSGSSSFGTDEGSLKSPRGEHLSGNFLQQNLLAGLMLRRQEEEIGEIEKLVGGSRDVPTVVSDTIGTALSNEAVQEEGEEMYQQHFQPEEDEKFSVSRMWKLVNDYSKASKKSYDALSLEMEKLTVIKHAIAIENRKNFEYIREIRNLENVISLLVRNRISVEEMLSSAGSDIMYLSKSGSIENEKAREFYQNLLHFVRHRPSVVATLVTGLKLVEIDSILELFMYGLYGSQYDAVEEQLVAKMFDQVIKIEVNRETTLSNFMRGTSALTRLMMAYARRGAGKMYLKKALAPVINDLIDKNLNIEIDLRKIYMEKLEEEKKRKMEEGKEENDVYDTNEEASPLDHTKYEEVSKNDEYCLKVRAGRIELLKNVVDRVIELISASVDEIPYVIRWICFSIRKAIMNRFPDADSDQVNRCIGGIILLRFINPCIVTPEVFNLISTNPTKIVRKSSTLVAKVLQSMSNNVLDVRVKASIQRDDYFESRRNMMYEFYGSVCSVKDPEIELEVEKYTSFQSANAIKVEVSINELYSLHNILMKYRKTLRSQLDESINDDIDYLITKYPFQQKPQVVPRSQNAILTLELFNSLLSDEDVTDIDLLQKYRSARDIVISLFRRTPQMFEGIDDNFISILTRIRDFYPDLHDSVWEVMKLLSELVKGGFLSETDNYEQLRRDVVEEYEKLDDLAEMARSDIKTLTRTLESVILHNGVLEGKLKMYDQYLRNVKDTVLLNMRKETKKEKKIRVNEQKRMKGKGYTLSFSHQHLESMGILVDTSVPPENRNLIYFQITQLNDEKGEPSEKFKVVWRATGRYAPLNHHDITYRDLERMERDGLSVFSVNIAQFDVSQLKYFLSELFLNRKVQKKPKR